MGKAMDIRTDYPFGLIEDENIWVPLPDGTRLAGRLWRPDGAGQVPVILEYLPYRKRDGTRARDERMHRYLARHGYACLRLDIRGTGDSEGVLHDEYSVQEQVDGVDAIAWLAAQPWCDGQVAMYGISWGGFNGLQIAARQPPALKTIITVGSTDDRYATDIHWVGGCLSKDNFDWSSTMFAMQDLPPDPVIVGEAWRAIWAARREANRPWILHWLKHQSRDDYWRQGSVCEDFSRITIPVYAVSGWADNYSEAVPRLLAGLSGPRLGLIGPWAHSFPHDVTVEPAIGWLQEVLRWCDHWLKGRDTGIMDEPMLRAWMQDHVPPQTCYRERPGRWVGEEVWPSPRIVPERLALGAGGRLGGPGEGTASICSPLWVGLTAGEVGRYGDEAEWATDQREDDGGSLVFVTEPLAGPLEILGAPQLHLRFASDKPFALVSVRVNDVAPSGASTRVAIGHLNLCHRHGHGTPQALVPGQVETAVVDLDDIAHRFPAGHRIAVSISTVYWPIAWPSPELATLTVHLGDSALDLPVRPPRAEDATLRAFDPPEAAAADPQLDLPPDPSAPVIRRTVTRDLLTGESVVDFPRWTYAIQMPDICQTHVGTGLARYLITEGDPLSATCETRYTVRIERPDAVITHESHGSLACDATHFIVTMRLRITENGVEVLTRDWNERIPRDHV
ncbi:MAG: CocE/NonD family hydrolase [Tabrizicola sp.]|uniref:CocE/NonD family hydrolase n=1 Tax=Tabrizicola sp. TaxID=2005166 RepID=UPI002734F5A6|nr:CocE/NonD family hydrolase [Tabrizicola sp.]MDP3647715.1 CocE/NonD family hydrolase [Paracoccaceae bacterium]MDZ4067382.1 CocE/NonD family hydrolase [Tabrizicola sp.]